MKAIHDWLFKVLELSDGVFVSHGAIFSVDRVSATKEPNDEGILLVGSFKSSDNATQDHLPALGQISLRHFVFLDRNNLETAFHESPPKLTPPEIVFKKSKL